MTITAIYENGVFRPLEPLAYREGEKVELGILEIIGPDGTRIPVPEALRPSAKPVNSNDSQSSPKS